MGMFDTVGTAAGQGQRKENTLRKLDRMKKALRHEEPDRVPISDFFWGGFIRRWRTELGLPADANPYYYYDLDWIVTVPNMDPWIRSFETLKETPDGGRGQDGLRGDHAETVPLPDARVHRLGDRHAGEAGSGRVRRSARPRGVTSRRATTRSPAWATVSSGTRPPWLDTVKSLWPDFPVYGSMTECSECMTRLIGPQNHMLWMALEPERIGAVLNRVGQFYLDCAKAAIDAAGPWLDGFVIWGDVAYKKGTFMRPDYWRTYYKPWVKAIVDHCPRQGARRDLPRLRQRQCDLRGLHRDRHRRLQPAGGQGGMDVARPAPPLRPSHGLLRQQRHPGLGDRATARRSAARCSRKLNAGPRRRVDLPVGPLRLQRRLRPDLRLHRQARARSTGTIRCNSASSTSRLLYGGEIT